MGVPFGAFMPDRAFVPGSTSANNNINTVDLPVNVGVIKCGKELILYDSGWKAQDYLKMTGSAHWAPLPDQLKMLGFSANDVTKIVIGHGHCSAKS
jgi:glyoxylase-like metal-dependent hydrolase (beta-lactamase superfamily II)